MSALKSPYDILGVKRDASDEEITRAYRTKAKECNGAGAASEAQRSAFEARLKQLNIAKDAIKKEREAPSFKATSNGQQTNRPHEGYASYQEHARTPLEQNCDEITYLLRMKELFQRATGIGSTPIDSQINRKLTELALRTSEGRKIANEGTLANQEFEDARAKIFSKNSLSHKFQVATKGIKNGAFGYAIADGFIFHQHMAITSVCVGAGAIVAGSIAATFDRMKDQKIEHAQKETRHEFYKKLLNHGMEKYVQFIKQDLG